MATHYCDDNDVARFLQVPNYTSSTFPLDSTVEDFINMSEQYID